MAFEQFPISPVPTQGRAAPFQLPQYFDPASIIAGAAQLKQQRDLTQQKLNQEALDSFLSSMNAAAHLSEQKREALNREDMARQTLELSQGKTKAEEILMQAHANYFNQMAGGGGDAVNGAVNMLKSGMATPQDIYHLTSRWPQGQKTQLVSALAQSGINLKEMGFDILGQQQQIKTERGTPFQTRVKSADSILSNFQNIIDMANGLDLSSFAPANKVKLAMGRMTNDKNVIKYDGARTAVTDEMAKFFSGTGGSSDIRTKLAQRMLADDGISGPALEASLLGKGGVADVIRNQAKAFSPGGGSPSLPFMPTGLPTNPVNIYSGMSDDQLRGLHQLYNGE